MITKKEDRDGLRSTIESAHRAGHREWGDGSILNLMDDIDTFKAALEQVEWIEQDDSIYCPWCNYWEHKGHAPDCNRQLALKEGE